MDKFSKAHPPNMQPDPSPPYTIFTDCQRRYIVFTAAGAALFSAAAPQIYYPVLNVLAEDFDVSVTAINLTVTSYMVTTPHAASQSLNPLAKSR